jgi:hypothetical protein
MAGIGRVFMKKITAVGIVVLICITPLFRGLFYNYETYGF